MPELTAKVKSFTGQTEKYNAIKPPVETLITNLAPWKDVWLRAGEAKQKEWLKGNKVPLMTVACLLYTHLKPFFENLETDIVDKKITADTSKFTVEVDDGKLQPIKRK